MSGLGRHFARFLFCSIFSVSLSVYFLSLHLSFFNFLFLFCSHVYMCMSLIIFYYYDLFIYLNYELSFQLYKYYIHKYMNEDKSNKYTKKLSNQFIFLLGSLGIGTAKD